MTATTSPAQATEKQIAFIARLLPTKIHRFDNLDLDTISKREAHLMIDTLLNAPDQPKPASEKLTPGVYRHEGEVYVVKPNREGSNLYAKQLIEIGGRRLTEAGAHQQIDFVYAPGIVCHIRAEEKLSFEEGKKLTVLYGRCICCGRTLKDAKSVEQGIGPVCRKLFTSF